MQKKVHNIVGALIAILYLLAIISLVGCGESENTSQTETEESSKESVQEESEDEHVIASSTNNVFLYSTENMDEYFKYLNSIDESKYEILNIETNAYEYKVSQEYYMITYKKIGAPKANPKGNMYQIFTSNEYFVFTTYDALVYLDFIDEMDFEKYKIIGFSRSGRYMSEGAYMITYTEI